MGAPGLLRSWRLYEVRQHRLSARLRRDAFGSEPPELATSTRLTIAATGAPQSLFGGWSQIDSSPCYYCTFRRGDSLTRRASQRYKAKEVSSERTASDEELGARSSLSR